MVQIRERVLGIDYGDIRIGLAVSDAFGITAQGIGIINIKDLEETDIIKRLEDTIKEYDIKKIVIGYPLNMNGTRGLRAEITDEFIKLISKRITLPIVKWDERLSTVSAQKVMHDMKIKTKNKKNMVDRIAASYILQSYLDSLTK